MAVSKAARIVPYLTPEEVYRIADACDGRNKERDSLLVLLLFQTGLRVSEALDITPRKIGAYNRHSVLYIKGKSKKPRMVACPDGLAYRLKSHAFDRKLGLDNRIFNINRKRAWQIVKQAGEKAGLSKKVWPHLF